MPGVFAWVGLGFMEGERNLGSVAKYGVRTILGPNFLFPMRHQTINTWYGSMVSFGNYIIPGSLYRGEYYLHSLPLHPILNPKPSPN